jgi:hypothetical protein
VAGIAEIVGGLKREEARLEKQLVGVKNAILSLGAVDAVAEVPVPRSVKRGPGRPPKSAAGATPTTPVKRRKMSAKARKAISDAQKARWARQKAGAKK